MNRVVERVVWVSMLLCLGVAVALFIQGERSPAVTMGCVALVLGLIGASGRRQVRRPPHQR